MLLPYVSFEDKNTSTFAIFHTSKQHISSAIFILRQSFEKNFIGRDEFEEEKIEQPIFFTSIASEAKAHTTNLLYFIHDVIQIANF